MSRRGSLYQPRHFPAIAFNGRAAARQGETRIRDADRGGTAAAAAALTAASALCAPLDALSRQVPADAAQRAAEAAEQFVLMRSGTCGDVGAIAAVPVWDRA